MESFKLNRSIAQLAILQRIELAGPVLKRVRKLFGRYLPTWDQMYMLKVLSYGELQRQYKDSKNVRGIGG